MLPELATYKAYVLLHCHKAIGNVLVVDINVVRIKCNTNCSFCPKLRTQKTRRYNITNCYKFRISVLGNSWGLMYGWCMIFDACLWTCIGIHRLCYWLLVF